jgi:hypothetical protein
MSVVRMMMIFIGMSMLMPVMPVCVISIGVSMGMNMIPRCMAMLMSVGMGMSMIMVVSTLCTVSVVHLDIKMRPFAGNIKMDYTAARSLGSKIEMEDTLMPGLHRCLDPAVTDKKNSTGAFSLRGLEVIEPRRIQGYT